MELNSSVNTFIGGMNMDSDISLLKENQYTYAENIRLLANEDSTTGILLNRDCLRKFKTFLKEDEHILGTVVTRIFKNNKSEECIVVITLDNKYNNIYIIYLNNDELTVTEFLKGANIGWTTALKIVANYESDAISKIYVADGIHHIKMINLNAKYDNVQIDENLFDITPNCVLLQPQLIEITNGSLEVGLVQYAFLLFTKHGSESQISVASTLIPIPKNKSYINSSDVKGGVRSALSNCGVKVNFEYLKGLFDMIRIYRLRYHQNNSVPSVYIANEIPLTDDSTNVTYVDSSDTILSEITVDEFNAMTFTGFVPKTIEKHDNRLFAANIKEDTWDIQYDARAYRCDNAGNITLHHSDSVRNITGMLHQDGTIDGNSVAEDHDCINPSNTYLFDDRSVKYAYGWNNGELRLGGSGPNISYGFCFTTVNLSDTEPYTSSDYNASSGNPESTYRFPSFMLITARSKINRSNKINIKDIDSNVIAEHDITDYNGTLLNYSSSYFTANFLGYQRDEIYRFGIVFFNEKGNRSPVHWIGDIRMPNWYQAEDVDSSIYPFHFDQTADDDGTSGKRSEMTGLALGITFTVNNVPEGIRWEIVRCPRTEMDRTIVTQGVLSSLIQFNDWGVQLTNLGTSDMRPMCLLNLSKQYNCRDYDYGYYKLSVVNDYYELISPEICVSRQSIIDNLNGCKLCPMYWLTSFFKQGTLSGTTQPNSWCIKQLNINTNDSSYPKSKTQNGFGEYISYSSFADTANGLSSAVLQFSNGGNSKDNGSYGSAGVLKYYKHGLPNEEFKTYDIEEAILSNILPRQYAFADAKNYAQPIGNMNYINTSIGSRNVMNNHGLNAVIKTTVPDSDKYFFHARQVNTFGAFHSMNATSVCNVKQTVTPYNGNSYSNRTNSTYINCVKHKGLDDNTYCVYGGDTYLNIFDYTHTTMRQNSNTPTDYSEYQMYMNCYIPLETTVNTHLISGPTYEETAGRTDNGTYGQNLIQYEPVATAVYTQTKPLYEYNSVYSTDANALMFVPKLLYSDLNSTYETRITCSELKTNSEIIDSWTKFKFANYLDVDNRYGPLTNLKSFNGKLFFWLDSAVGIASVNERSLITDNNISALTLGTGGILVRYDYYTSLNGSNIINDRSICNSVSTLYWYDSSKKEICAINNAVIELSKTKGVKSWSNKLDRGDAVGWYDWKYNEVLFQHPSDSSKRSLVFNEQLNTFTGFYTYPATDVAQMVDKLITFDKEGNLYVHNADTNYEKFESKVRFVVNKGYPETKVFDNVWFDATLADDKILKSIVFKTKTQETKSIGFNEIENREDTYRFPIPRDKNGVARMRGKYLICDYTFDCINDGDFKIPYIKTTFRISRV